LKNSLKKLKFAKINGRNNAKNYLFSSANVIQVMLIFYMACFWSAMVSYIGISVMKLLAMARPLQYKSQITMRRTKAKIDFKMPA
jgi:hypothetical protein